MKILIVRIGAMGDVLHALPAVAALRVAHPEATIDWLVDRRWMPLLAAEGNGPVVSRAIPVDIGSWKQSPLSVATLRGFLGFRGLRSSDYDLVLDMQGTLRSAGLGRLAALGAFAGFADPREALAARLYKLRVQRRGAHVVDQGAALLGDALRITLTPIAAALPRDREAESWGEEAVLSRPLAMLAPGAGWAAKQWPAERFGQLAAPLRERGYDVVINAASAENAVARAVAVASKGAARVQPCGIAQMVALLRRTDLFVGGDSGPTHLAAALAVPLVALFGPTDPARNGPWGPGAKEVLRDPASATSYRHTAKADPGLARIAVEDVLAAVDRLRTI